MEVKSERKVDPKTDQHCNLILTGFGSNFRTPFGSLWRGKVDSKLHPKILAPPGSSLASPGSGPALGGGHDDHIKVLRALGPREDARE